MPCMLSLKSSIATAMLIFPLKQLQLMSLVKFQINPAFFTSLQTDYFQIAFGKRRDYAFAGLLLITLKVSLCSFLVCRFYIGSRARKWFCYISVLVSFTSQHHQ